MMIIFLEFFNCASVSLLIAAGLHVLQVLGGLNSPELVRLLEDLSTSTPGAFRKTGKWLMHELLLENWLLVNWFRVLLSHIMPSSSLVSSSNPTPLQLSDRL